MTQIFGATSTTDDVLSGVSLRDKRVLVTGVSAGIGVETARALASRGAHVVVRVCVVIIRALLSEGERAKYEAPMTDC